MHRSLPACLPLVCAILTGILAATAFAVPEFDPPQPSGDSITLRLRGEAGKKYRIEASSDLASWNTLVEGTPADGVLSFEHPRAEAGASRYYRGMEVSGGTLYPTVTPESSTTFTVNGLISPETGGFLQFESLDGVLYTWEIPAGAVLEPVMARMTLLSTVTGIPAADGFLGAVRLEPAGLVLAAPTFLQIRFPTDQPSPRLASYSFDNDGTHFHLTPDLVTTREVRIWVSQLRSYGTGKFTLEEIQAIAVPKTAPAPTAPAPRPRPRASRAECFPEEEEEATDLHEQLTERMRPYQESFAAEISIERQKQLLGAEDTGNETIVSIMQQAGEFYQAEIQPLIPQAASKCAVAQEMLKWVLGWERQQQLLGIENPSSDSTLLICAGLKRCQEQVLECCRTKGPDTRLVRELLGIERQRQLLGASDGDCGVLPDNWVECIPQWYGELTITEKILNKVQSVSPDLVVNSTESVNYEFSAIVDTAKIEIIEPFPLFGIPGYTSMEFKLSGTAEGTHTLRATSETPGGACSNGTSGSPLGEIPRPLDEVGGFSNKTLMSSVLEKPVSLDLSVTILDPGETQGVFYKNRLFCIVDPCQVPFSGIIRKTTGMPSGGGCIETTEVIYPKDMDIYAGEFIDVEGDQFSHTPDRIRYTKTTTNQGRTRVVTVDLKRRP